MTKEQKIEAYSMRLDGVPIRKIAEKYGVSYQCIQQLFPGIRKDYREKYKSCIYPNIVKFLIKNSMSINELAKRCNLSYVGLHDFLNGGKKKTVDKILKATGMTYEEAFAEEAQDETRLD